MRNIAILMFAVSILLTGAIAQEYTQTVERDGDSRITKTFATTLLHGYDIEAIEAVCENEEYSCSIENGKMSITISAYEGSKYYQEETDYGLPFITYTLTLRSVPTDLFSQKLNEILVASGQEERTEVPATEIWKRDSEAVSTLRSFGDISYTIYMPGWISETNIGEVKDSAVTFMFSEAYQEETSIIIKSQDINSGYFVLVVMAIVIVAFTFSFLKKKKPAPARPVEPRRKKRTGKK